LAISFNHPCPKKGETVVGEEREGCSYGLGKRLVTIPFLAICPGCPGGKHLVREGRKTVYAAVHGQGKQAASREKRKGVEDHTWSRILRRSRGSMPYLSCSVRGSEVSFLKKRERGREKGSTSRHVGGRTLERGETTPFNLRMREKEGSRKRRKRAAFLLFYRVMT